MPSDEEEMDRVYEVGCKLFLKKMETGKFYSYRELSKLILENSIHRPKIESHTDCISSTLLDMAYVEAVIQAQYAVGNLRAGEKEGERYYSKVDSKL